MTPTQQITLRLPADLARQLAARTPSRKRNQFVVDLVRRELERESRELEDAAKRLSMLEQNQAPDDADWLSLDDESAWGEFDEQRFLKELNPLAQSKKSAKAARP